MALDASRAIAVFAMIFGHTLSALISPEGRLEPWVAAYWHVRAFTAPLFLFVSGFVLFFVVDRRGLYGRMTLRAYGRRVALLFALGYLMRLPLWDLAGLVRLDPALWRYFSTFDALQCIAAAMFVTLCICAILRPLWGRVGVLAALGLVTVLSAPSVWRALGSAEPGLVAQTFGGGDALFPVFPWTAYFFSGGCAVALHRKWGSVALGSLAALAALLAAPAWPWSVLSPTDPVRFLGTLAVVLAVVAATSLLPVGVSRLLAPVGRASLWAYVVHLPVIYGWAYWHGLEHYVGHSLSAINALLASLAMVAGCVVAALAAKRWLNRMRLRRLLGRGLARWRADTPVTSSKAVPRKATANESARLH